MSLVCIKSRRALVGNSQKCKRSTVLLEGLENQNPESYLRLFCYFLQTLVGLIVHTNILVRSSRSLIAFTFSSWVCMVF